MVWPNAISFQIVKNYINKHYIIGHMSLDLKCKVFIVGCGLYIQNDFNFSSLA